MLRIKKRLSWPVVALIVVALLILATGVAFAARGEPGPGGGGGGDIPPDSGPGSHESETGTLFGDLYKLLRYHGGEEVLDESDALDHVAVGGEPILSDGFGYYALELSEEGGYSEEATTTASANPDLAVPIPPEGLYSRVVQPVASYERWGDIWTQWKERHPEYVAPVDPITGVPSEYEANLDRNRIPLVITYDSTWNRFEAEVGLLLAWPTVDPVLGTLNYVIEEHFIHAGDIWDDPIYGVVEHEEDILWADLIQEVEFGRISVSRAPEAVLQSAFDEVVNAINSDDTVALEIDAAGRLLLTKRVYDEYGDPVIDADTLEQVTAKKAIDSPLENLALYTKLLNDGHLVTPGDEREPIDRSPEGGIPLWKEIEMEDGPSNELRPTINIAKMEAWGLGALVDVNEVDYYAYYAMEDSTEPISTTPGKGKGNKPPPSVSTTEPPDMDPDYVPVYTVEPYVEPADLFAALPDSWTCPDPECVATKDEFTQEGEGAEALFVCDVCGYVYDAKPSPVWTGIMADDDSLSADAGDFPFAASFLSAAADKTKDIGVDFLVYLNSILGINLVVGTNEDGTIDYSEDPYYFDFSLVTQYGRGTTFSARGERLSMGGPDGNGGASTYDGSVLVLQQTYPVPDNPDVLIGDEWTVEAVTLTGLTFDDLGQDPTTHFPTNPPSTATGNILGFTQMADDDLSVIEFIHTYQIPERR